MRAYDLILCGIAALIFACTFFVASFVAPLILASDSGTTLSTFKTESIETHDTATGADVPFLPNNGRSSKINSSAQTANAPLTTNQNLSQSNSISVVDMKGITADDEPPYAIGEHLRLLPQNSHAVVTLPGVIQFLAKLENPSKSLWQVQVEAIVTNSDGSKRLAVGPRTIWVLPGQTITLPIKFRAREPKYQQGFTLFEAFIKDLSGNVIDQASIAFMLEKIEAAP